MHGEKVCFVILGPRTGRHGSVLICVHFVLNGDRLNGDSFGFIAAQEFKKIVCIRSYLCEAHTTTEKAAIGFHPARRAPWGSEQKNIGIEAARFPESR